MFRVRTALTVLAFAGLMSSGCEKANTLAPPRDLSPAATSPAAAVKRLEWAFNNRDVEAIDGLLTADLSFWTTVVDSAGNGSGLEEWTREQLLASLQALLKGDQGAPAAARVQLTLDANPSPFPDSRPGHNSVFHRSVRTSLDVRVEAEEGNAFEATGHLLCYLTRGDSASIPTELLARCAKPDTARWWIDRIEDETISTGFHTTPSHLTSFADILRLWHHAPSRP